MPSKSLSGAPICASASKRLLDHVLLIVGRLIVITVLFSEPCPSPNSLHKTSANYGWSEVSLKRSSHIVLGCIVRMLARSNAGKET